MNKLILILMFLLLVVSCSKDADKNKMKSHGHSNMGTTSADLNVEAKTYYTCSMHPKVRQDRPGKCPICHMNLTKFKVEVDDEVETVSSTVKNRWKCDKFPDVTSEKPDTCPRDGTPMIKVKNSAASVIAKIRLRKSQLTHFRPNFFPATTMKMIKKISLLGSVLQSEEKESSIPARIAGRVEKVYVKSRGSLIQKGDPVVDIYSPKLITAGEEYLLARQTYLKNKSNSGQDEFKSLYEQSEQRLKLWGIRKFQYERWFKNKKVPRKITIYSSASGIVRKRNANVGKYFKEGQNFFELSDLSDVWVEMDVYEQDTALVKLGQKVQLEFISLPGEIIKGEIDFINPVLDSKSRTLKIRATIKNDIGKLRPGMIATTVLNIELAGMPLVIPRSAIIDTGKRKVVWTKISEKKYQAKVIQAGHESDGYVEIKHGLMKGEEVVVEGNFLLDAQAQLFGGYEEFARND
jgi:RND family efflux transporter MFP subunit